MHEVAAYTTVIQKAQDGNQQRLHGLQRILLKLIHPCEALSRISVVVGGNE